MKRAGRGKVYVVEINESGFPISVRLRTSSEPLWCIYKSAENIFPVIKTKPKPNRDYETVINTAIGNCVRFAKQLSLFETAAAMANIEPGIWYEKFKEIWEDAKEQGILADNDDYRKGYLLISRGHEYTPYEYNAIVSSVSVDGKLGVCSLTGQQGLIETHTFPSPNLPGLGNTYLFAKNEDIPCFKRYATNGAGSISVSKQALTELSGKLAALTQNQWRGKTWAQLKINGHNALLLAHTDTDTTDFAELLASDDELYPIVCQKVLSALSVHHKTGANPSLVKILCLRVLDTGTRGVEFEREIDSAVLLSNLKAMLAVVRNAPVFAGFRRDTLKLLSPYSISLLLEHQYRSDGGKTVVHSNHFETCFELLTGDAQEAAEKLLPVALQRVTTLLVDGSHTTDYKNGISVLYVLRGGLMDTTAFKIGRYVSVVDWLHGVYCEQVRGGGVPAQLVGSAYLPQVLTNPQRGFGNMALRLAPYLSWGKTRGATHAKHIVGTLNKLATEIKEGGLGTKTTDKDRADILLGFHFRKPAQVSSDSAVCDKSSKETEASATAFTTS